MNPNILSLCLVCLLIAQEIHHYLTTQKLINKVMSGSFQEYKQAEAFGKPRAVKTPSPESPGAQEDLGVLNQIVS